MGKPVGDLIIAPYFWICAVASAQSGIGAAVGGERRTIEIGQKAQRG